MTKALLVDDEENNLSNLEFILTHDCSDIAVVGKCLNASEARNFLQSNLVDVIFLDINMPDESGFELLQSLSGYNFKVIFVTAHNEYSLQAIKASALDYVLKPVSIEDIQQAVGKLKEVMKSVQAADLSQQLLKNFLALSNHHELPQRIALPQLGGVTYLDVNEIVSLQADGNYTIIHKQNMQKMVITKTLKDFEEILDDGQFVRIHKSYIVNLQQVKEYSTLDGGIAKMVDGNTWSISRRQLDSFLSKMNHSSLSFKKEH